MALNGAIHEALQANKDHQNALNEYIGCLKDELGSVDKMLEVVESHDDTEEESGAGLVYVENAMKPASLLPISVLQSDDSPFHQDAKRRQCYEEFTITNQKLGKTKEREAFREAVRAENMRIQVLEAQNRNQSFTVGKFPPEHFEHNAEGIDWRRVAVKIDSLIPNAGIRTPRECEIRWRGHLHPSINNDAWTEEETARLQDIVGENGVEKSSRNWVEIAKRLGTNRTPIDCMRHGLSRKVHTWTPEADRKLLEAVGLFGQNNWQLVAMNVSEDATAQQCQKRYFDSLDPSIKNGPWTSEEEGQLRRAVAAFCGTSTIDEVIVSGERFIPWQDVALFVPGRTNNQCREHYQDCISRSKRKQKHNDQADYPKETDKERSTAVTNHNENVSVLERREDSIGGTVGRGDGREPESSTRTDAIMEESNKAAERTVTATLESPNNSHTPKHRPRGRPRKKPVTEDRSTTVKQANMQASTTENITAPAHGNETRIGATSESSSGLKVKGRQRSSARVASRRRSTRLAAAQTEHEMSKTADDIGGTDDEVSPDAFPSSKRQRTRKQ